MVNLFETMVKFFEDDEWPITPIGESFGVSMTFEGDNGQWPCIAQVDETQGRFLFYSAGPDDVPEDRRADMSEYVTRANYGMLMGNFELDLGDGDFRYKTSLDIREVAGLDETTVIDLIRLLVYANVMTMDRYLPGAVAVVTGTATPAAAIAAVEG